MRAEIKLIKPKVGRTSFYRVRGTYLGQYVDRSTKARDRATAHEVLNKIKREIERGEFEEEVGPTFASAATRYMNAHGERRFMAPILVEIGSMKLGEIDQAVIEKVASKLHAGQSPATLNRQVYTPIMAVMTHAKVAIVVERPKGAQGNRRTAWLRPQEADKLLAAAWRSHPRFAALCTTLLYTGLRLSEALRLQPADVHLDEAYAEIATTKNGMPRGVHLPPIVVTAIRRALMEHGQGYHTKPRTEPRTEGRVFCLSKCAHLYKLLTKAEEDSGVQIPPGVSFHCFRHTYGAWMRRYGGLDRAGLVATGAWSSSTGAASYDHLDVTESAKRADLFPGATDAVARAIKTVGEDR